MAGGRKTSGPQARFFAPDGASDGCQGRLCAPGPHDEQSKTGGEYSINNNVLIEIGAAFVLYNKRVVLLWDKRLKVPSNLQGLYRCEFEGNELSFAIGTKLAKAVKGFRIT